jgi:hypothetical protein
VSALCESLRRNYQNSATIQALADPIYTVTGPVVRTTPNSLSFSSPKALHQIYGSRAVNVRKSQFYTILDSGSGGSTTHTEIDKEKHAARRRILSHAFSDSALREAETFVLANARKFVNLIGIDGTENQEKAQLSTKVVPTWTSPRDMSKWWEWCAYDIMGNLVFGKSYNCLESDRFRRMPTLMTEGTKFGYWVSSGFVTPLETFY